MANIEELRQVAKSDPHSEKLVTSPDPSHPANLISTLCAHFYTLGWVTGTGGGMSVRDASIVYLAPTGVQKEKIRPTDIFVLDWAEKEYPRDGAGHRISHHDLPYLRRPRELRASACTPLFLASYRLKSASCCIHTHSQWAVLVTLLIESTPNRDVFEIEQIEQIKGIPKGRGKAGNLGYHDRLRVPIIENTALEENLTDSLEAAMQAWPDTYAVLVRRHGIYVWGDNVAQAKTICESLDYLFRLAVEMRQLGLPWVQ